MVLPSVNQIIQFLSQLALTAPSPGQADPSVRVADISPNRGVSFPKGSLFSVFPFGILVDGGEVCADGGVVALDCAELAAYLA